jgi:hypothetical protein
VEKQCLVDESSTSLLEVYIELPGRESSGADVVVPPVRMLLTFADSVTVCS